MKKGIDVSEFQEKIDWEKVKPNIDFAILRAGFGKNHIDARFERNASECKRLGIPFGAYWFSYALDEDMAKNEGNYICDLVSKYNPTYPICFDYEYDSTAYAKRSGITTESPEHLEKLARAFLTQVENRGYYAMNYTNLDYHNRGMGRLTDRFDTWLAQWGVSKNGISCGIWQHSNKGSIPGITGDVDLDYSYNDYPAIITKSKTEKNKEIVTDAELKACEQYGWDKYSNLAKEIMNGKWGAGYTRLQALHSNNYDYDFAQSIVNLRMGVTTSSENELRKEMWDKYYQIAKDIWAGKYGAGTNRRDKLVKLNYDYEYAQRIVTAMQ